MFAETNGLDKTKVRLARQRLGIRSDRQLSQLIGVPATTFFGYLTGRQHAPAWVLFALADVLHVSPQALTRDEHSGLVPVPLSEEPSRRKVPLMGIIPASRRDASLPSQGPLDFVSLPEGIAADEALEVRNGCMSPTLTEGDIVFIRRSDVAVPGKIYVLEVVETGERTLKRCRVVKGRVRFVADNPEYADAEYSLGEVRVLAEVTGWLHRER